MREPLIQTFKVQGQFPSLNEWARADYRMQARQKRDAEEAIMWAVKTARLRRVRGFVEMRCVYYEPSRRRDLDNVSAVFRKFALDALQKLGVVANDRKVVTITDVMAFDKDNPRIEVTLRGEEDR